MSQSALPKEDSQPIPAPQQQQQVSTPRPSYVSHDRRAVGRTTPSVEKTNRNDDANEPANNIRFVQQDGNIVPAGPIEVKEIGEQREPSANDLEQKQKDVVERPNVINEEKNGFDEEQRKQVMSPPLNRNDDGPRNDNASVVPGSQAEQPLVQPAVERASTVASGRSNDVKAHAEDDELQALQERVDGIFNRDMSHNDNGIR